MTMKRHIVIGDIHGCFDELRELLDRVAPSGDDVVVSAGDVVRKGPAPDLCLDLWRARGWDAVLGNQERKLLDLVKAKRVSDEPDQRVANRRELLDFIREWPLLLDFEEAGFAVVHGGLMPGTSMRDTLDDSVLTLRYIRRAGEGWTIVPKRQEQPGDRFWTEEWDGPRTIVYGHTPRPEVRRDAKAIGLDTACVYGGSLSAAILKDGEWTIEAVKARRQYAQPAM